MRYVSVPTASPRSAWWMEDSPMLPALNVPDTRPVDTGLLDVRGDRFMRIAPPIGFGRDEEWS